MQANGNNEEHNRGKFWEIPECILGKNREHICLRPRPVGGNRMWTVDWTYRILLLLVLWSSYHTV